MTDNPDVDRESHHQSGAEMEIIFYHPTFDPACWLPGLRNAIPGANVRAWRKGDDGPADYALVWHPPVEMLRGRELKGVFALGPGSTLF
jgi:glyoxylate/hydroxypyruvate reductase A